jgi:hypothetical protein
LSQGRTTEARTAMTTDNLNPPPALSRVYYALGRMLGAEDFQSDQDYHRGSLARALLQLCGTGTVAGLYVTVPQLWDAATTYAAGAFVYDANKNVQLNTGTAGASGAGPITFAAAPGGTVNDANGIVWTNVGPLVASGWLPNTTFAQPTALEDSNGNVQVLSVTPMTSGANPPVWNTSIGGRTLDGNPQQPAWTCAGPAQIEVSVAAGLAIDRVGRMIEVPRSVCIYLQPWLAARTVSDLTSALHGPNILVDVFAAFVPCTQGVTPSFATQDDYNATDAFCANRLLDSFAMQLVLRTDANPLVPQDPWVGLGAAPGAVTSPVAQALKQSILLAKAGPAAMPPFAASGSPGTEYPPGLDTSSVFLARLFIPATAPTTAGQPPLYNVNQVAIDNLSRLFLYSTSMVARTLGFSSGTTS